MLFRRRSRGRKIYVTVRTLVAIALIIVIGGVNEFMAMTRSAAEFVASVQAAAESGSKDSADEEEALR